MPFSGDKDGIMLYKSKQGHALLCQVPTDVPIVVLENYEKWYSIHILQPDGKVEEVNPTLIEMISVKVGRSLWIDHCYHPLLLLLIADIVKGVADFISMEAAAGRWIMEGHDCYAMFYFLDKEDEGKIELLLKDEISEWNFWKY